MKKSFLRLFMIFSIIPFASSDAFGASGNSVQYIEKVGSDGAHILHTEKPVSDPFAYKITVGASSTPFTPVMEAVGGTLRFKNIAKSGNSYDISEPNQKVGESLSKATYTNVAKIPFRNEDTTFFNGISVKGTSGGMDSLLVKFNPENAVDPSTSTTAMGKTYSIIVNGKESALKKDEDGLLKSDEYLIGKEGIRFLSKNLKDPENMIMLKIDGSESNFTVISKETLAMVENPNFQIEDLGDVKNLILKFNRPTEIMNTDDLEVTIDGTKISNNLIVLGNGSLTLKHDLMKVKKDAKAIEILFKIKSTNTYSKKIYFNVENLMDPTITGVDFGNTSSNNLTINLQGNAVGLIGDIFNLKVNLNGVDYSMEGNKENKADANGDTVTDANGKPIIVYTNKISLSKPKNGLTLSIGKNSLATTKNLLYIKNENTGRKSNTIAFDAVGFTVSTYRYSSEVIWPDAPETIHYDNIKNFEETFDFLNKQVPQSNLGKLIFADLKENDIYDFSFSIETDSKINPFSSLYLNAKPLTSKSDSKGNTVYTFASKGIGKSFQDANITYTLNSLFNNKVPDMHLRITGMMLKRLSSENIYADALKSVPEDIILTFSYLYDFSNCFDGGKDFCEQNGLKDPSLIVRLGSGNGGGIGSALEERGGRIDTLAFKSAKFKEYNRKFIALYERYKDMKLDEKRLNEARNAINNILACLKNIEDGRSKKQAISLMRSFIKTLGSIAKSASK